MTEKIAVIGLGYVGLPLAVAFGKKHKDVVGFDIDATRIDELKRNIDRTRETEPGDLETADIVYTDDENALDSATIYVVTVPTPIDSAKRPDLTPVKKASECVGRHLKKGDIVVYESTVYPGVTEEICGPILAQTSGLTQGEDFKLGYSPERINPGDKVHRLETIVKVVAAEDEASMQRIGPLYESIIDAGIHRAPTIQTAEAAKVIENTQRDLNIALMNELALIFDRMGIRTLDVLDAAATKWNFLRFTPGLVGGHCIGVDPYYLTAKAEALGYNPEVILAGRRINDSMGSYVAQRTIKELIAAKKVPHEARIAIAGLTFKENVPDLRNSRVPDIVKELQEYGIDPIIHDPLADPTEAYHEFGIRIAPGDALVALDALIIAVPHEHFTPRLDLMLGSLNEGGVLVDVKSMLKPEQIPSSVTYWSL